MNQSQLELLTKPDEDIGRNTLETEAGDQKLRPVGTRENKMMN